MKIKIKSHIDITIQKKKSCTIDELQRMFRICSRTVRSSQCLRNLWEYGEIKEKAWSIWKFHSHSGQLMSKLNCDSLNRLFNSLMQSTFHRNENLTIYGYKNDVHLWNIPGMIFPLNLTHESAHIWPSKYDPYIFLHCAQFLKQMPIKSKSPAESSWTKSSHTTKKETKNDFH